MGKITQWLAGVLAGITSIFSPGTATLSETADYLAYPPLPEFFTEDYARYIIYYLERPTDARMAEIYDEFYSAGAWNENEYIQLGTFTWYGTPGTGDDPFAECTPVYRMLKFNKDAWEHGALNILYTERTTFSQNVCITSANGDYFLDYIEFTYNETKDKWEYYRSSLESDSLKAKQLFCSYIISSNPLGGTKEEQYTGHCQITSDTFHVDYTIYKGSVASGILKTPLYGFWLGYEGGGVPDPGPDPDPPDPPDPPEPPEPDNNLNKDTDGDGIPDINIDTDNDGEADINIDTNGDDIPDLNIDTNGDNSPDINIDTDGDGKANLNIDNIGDKKPHINVDTNGDNKPDINIDTDGDGQADLNIDTTGNGKPDINIDTDGDNKADINIDTDGDNKPDVNIDTDGDQKPDINIDTDGDSIPDRDIDTDGDGKPDKKVSHSDIGDGSEFIPDDSYTPEFEGWHLFNPYDYEDTYTDPFSDDEPYDPLAGWEVADKLPGYETPSISWGGHCWEPFVKPVQDMVNGQGN